MDTDSNSRDRIFPECTRIGAKGLNIACGGSPQARAAPRGRRASIRRSAPDDYNLRDCFVSFVAFCEIIWVGDRGVKPLRQEGERARGLPIWIRR